jgi:hypothetical protein
MPRSLRNGYLLTAARPCGVVFERWVTPEHAEYLLHFASLNWPLRHLLTTGEAQSSLDNAILRITEVR